MFDLFVQSMLAILGLGAIALTQSKDEKRRKWSSVVGLAGQPFWLYAAWPQPGMFLVCILYTVVWGKGFYSNWIKK